MCNFNFFSVCMFLASIRPTVRPSVLVHQTVAGDVYDEIEAWKNRNPFSSIYGVSCFLQ